jgi:DNA-binding transcriptional LysR family regulator
MLHEIDLHRVDLNLLVLLNVLVKERHVGRAATQLNLSPSAVSHALGRLRRLLNDQLFVRHPKGLNPTERALALAEPVAEILDRARTVFAEARPFDPASSRRRFVIGAVEGIGPVVVPGLVAAVSRLSPGIVLAVRSVFPHDVAERLDRRAIDLALTPLLSPPARFATRDLYVDEFVVAVRVGHPYLNRPSLDAYCQATHLLVAQGDDRGHIDDALHAIGVNRSIGLSVPSAVWALNILAETDLLAALPRRLVARYSSSFGVTFTELPFKMYSDTIGVVMPKAALNDTGLQWLVAEIGGAVKR